MEMLQTAEKLHFLKKVIPNIFFLSLLTVNLAVGVPITYKLLTFDY